MLWPTLGTVMHPLYMVVNAILLGHLEDPIYLASFGLGSMMLNFLVNSLSISFSFSLETLVAQSYGQGELEMCGHYLRRQ